jgi:hypothetical protein
MRGVTKLPEREGACPCPRSHHTSIGAHLGTVQCSASRARGASSFGLSPLAHPRPGGFQQAGSGSGFRLRLSEDRRRFMFGHHASGAPRRVDSLRGDRDAASNSTRGLRSHEIGLQLAEVAVDGCIAKAPCGGEKAGKSPVDRGKQGIKRSTAVDGRGIPIGGVSAPAKAATIRRFWSLPSSAPGRRWKGYLI